MDCRRSSNGATNLFGRRVVDAIMVVIDMQVNEQERLLWN